MHICIVSPGYPTTKTIDFVFVDQLCRALADKDHTITIIVPQSVTKSLVRRVPLSPLKSILTTSSGKKIQLFRPVYLSVGTIGEYKNSVNRRIFNIALNHVFTRLKNKPDVCYGHFWDSVYSLLPLAKRYNIPLIASSGEEEVTIQNKIPRKELISLASYVTGVISVSSKNKKECIAAELVKNEDCIVIPNAVDVTLFYPKDKMKLREQHGFDKKVFIVAFVGQFNSRKGAARLSDALTLLNDDTIKAVFMGSGSELPNYKGTLLAKTIPHDLLPDYLNSADAFVLPTLNEGCSNAVIEAMACGLPIISSDLSFNHDILNEDNSILIEPNSITQIAEAIKQLKNNPLKRKELSFNALKTSSSLTLSKRSEKIINFIQTRIQL